MGVAEGGEGEAVDGGGAVLGDGGEVLGGAVPFVLGELVGGVVGVLGFHVLVAGDFGEDGGAGDGEAFAVAAYDALLGGGEGGEANPAVDQQIVCGNL